MRHSLLGGGPPRVLRRWAAVFLALILGMSVVGLAGCGPNPDAYGGTNNHVHDILALAGVPHTVLLATHIGLYRTSDDGGHWSEVAGGSGQAMNGLMLFKLAQSPVNSQRVYVVAIPRPDNPGAAKSTVGIYVSADAGKTWALAAPASAFPSGQIFSIATGAQGAGQLYAILPSLGNRGVYVSNDAGHSWSVLATLPTADPTGLCADPAHPGTLFLWSAANGLFVSRDAGSSWSSANGMNGGVYSVSVSGSNVYVMGDQGFARSQDDGATFAMVDQLASYSAVFGAPSNAARVYAVTGTSVLTSTDAGSHFRSTAQMTSHPTTISVDPQNPTTIFVAYSYPVGVARTTNGGGAWTTVLP